MKFYALADKAKPYEFYVKASDMDNLNNRIEKRFWQEKGMNPRGSKFEMSDFMSDKVIVLVTIEVDA